MPPAPSSAPRAPGPAASAAPLRLQGRESLPELIATSVAEAIAARQLLPGERIVETGLAALLEVSRVPVREALKVLHTQGIIDGGGHRGFRVASFSPRMVADVQAVRLDLEVMLLRDALDAWRDGRADPARLDEAVEVMRVAARLGDVRAILRADIAFHRVICDAADNPVVSTLWRAIARHVLIILNLARFRDIDLGVVVRRHEALRDRIRALSADGGPAAETRALLEAHFLAERPALGTEGGEAAAAVSPPASPRPRGGGSPW